MDKQLAAAVIHDVKNALGLLEAELSVLCSTVATAEGLARAHQQCSRLRLRLIGFLSLYQAEHGDVRPTIQDQHPEGFLREVLADFGAWSGPAVELAVSESAPQVAFFDARLVSLALHAALSNAKAFAKSSITLGVRGEGRAVTFFVLDDGPGLGSGPTPGGTGMGTTVVNLVTAAHSHGAYSGTASMKNAPQGGALFELTLP